MPTILNLPTGYRELAVKLFSGRVAELEMQNRVLTDAARKRAERVEQLETQAEKLVSMHVDITKQLADLQEQNRQLTQAATDRALRAQELEQLLQNTGIECGKKLAALQEHNRQLTEAATQYALRAQALERELAESKTKLAQQA